MLDRPDEAAGSVLSMAKSYLALYRDPVVQRNVTKSEFRIKDLMNFDDPVSQYIVTQPNDKARLRPLVRIMLNMVVRLLGLLQIDRKQKQASLNDYPDSRFPGRAGADNTKDFHPFRKPDIRPGMLSMLPETREQPGQGMEIAVTLAVSRRI